MIKRQGKTICIDCLLDMIPFCFYYLFNYFLVCYYISSKKKIGSKIIIFYFLFYNL